MSASSLIRSPALRRVAVIALALVLAVPAAAGAAPKPRLSLTDVEQEFMCPTCHEPLEVAQSPQAVYERAYISSLIAKGETKSQIENALVAQYGPTVLGVPRAQGFDLTVYVVPPLLLLAGIASLAVLIPRWRRRARAAAAVAVPTGPGVDTADAQRLEAELARYDG